MKRTGHIYERMQDWNTLVMAENISCRGKSRNKGVCLHEHDFMRNRIINAPQVSMLAVLDRPVVIKDVVSGIKTAHGEGRMALLIELYGQDQKLIVNSQPIKSHIDQMLRLGVTMHSTVFVDRGGRHYDVDLDRTVLLEVNHRSVTTDPSGHPVFEDTHEPVILNT